MPRAQNKRRPLTSEEQGLVVANMGLVWKEVLRQNPPSPHDADDMAQTAVFGLINAVQAFTPERGLKLSTLALVAIRRCLLKYKLDRCLIRPKCLYSGGKRCSQFRSAEAHVAAGAKCFHISRIANNTRLLSSTAPDPFRYDGLHKAMKSLSRDDGHLIHLYFFDDVPLRTIADKLGGNENKESVRRRLKLVLEKMRRMLVEDE